MDLNANAAMARIGDETKGVRVRGANEASKRGRLTKQRTKATMSLRRCAELLSYRRRRGFVGGARMEISMPPARWEETDDVQRSSWTPLRTAGGYIPPVKLSVGLP